MPGARIGRSRAETYRCPLVDPVETNHGKKIDECGQSQSVLTKTTIFGTRVHSRGCAANRLSALAQKTATRSGKRRKPPGLIRGPHESR